MVRKLIKIKINNFNPFLYELYKHTITTFQNINTNK